MEQQESGSKSSLWQRLRLSPNQWAVLIVMGGMLLAIGAVLVLVLRSVGTTTSVDTLATVVAGPTPMPTPPLLVPDAVPTSSTLYWPPDPQPLATPNVANDLLWWNARFAYRRPILTDTVSSQLPAGTWAQVLFDGEGAQREGKMRTDGMDLRVVAWDGAHWWEIPRQAQPRLEKRGWKVLFHLQAVQVTRNGSYYLYYGQPFVESAPLAEDAPESSRLLLDLGDEQGVEWGPEIAWTAHSTSTQTLVSSDGRIVIQCLAGGPSKDVRVRLRTVPIGEKNTRGPLPDVEFHADPFPGPPNPNNVPHWDPPLTIVINWAGLPVSVRELENQVHFEYDQNRSIWYDIPVVLDQERGLARVTTTQP